MSDTTQAVAKTPAQTKLATTGKPTTADLLKGDAFKERIINALPKHLAPDRMIAVALTCLNRTPLLAQCTQESFFGSMLNLSQLGIEPDGRRAHLIPFKNNKKGCYECQLIIDYKGLVDLAMRSGQVSNIHADVVCANDVFEYDMGEIKTHKIDFQKPRGDMFATYCVCTFKDGTKKCDVMSKLEVDSIRKRSRAGDSGPWVTDYAEMAKKTVFKRLSKWLPLSPEYRDAVEKDDDYPRDITREVRSASPLANIELPEHQDEAAGEAQPESSPAPEPVSQEPVADGAETSAPELPY